MVRQSRINIAQQSVIHARNSELKDEKKYQGSLNGDNNLRAPRQEKVKLNLTPRGQIKEMNMTMQPQTKNTIHLGSQAASENATS